MRFVAFAWDTYYPTGGMNDCVGITDTEEEACALIEKAGRDRWQLVDAETLDILAEGTSIAIFRKENDL